MLYVQQRIGFGETLPLAALAIVHDEGDLR